MLQTAAKGQDLRAWIEEMVVAGELLRIQGAEREQEIGGIVDIYQRKIGWPALLFENIPNYPPGFRVLANLFVSVKRIALTLGLPENTSEIELVRFWRDYFRDAPTIEPTEAQSGPIFETYCLCPRKKRASSTRSTGLPINVLARLMHLSFQRLLGLGADRRRANARPIGG
jgi:hypothetical protein